MPTLPSPTAASFRTLVLVAASLCLVQRDLPALAQGGRFWSSAGQNLHNTRHASTEKRISPETVSELAVQWVFQAGGNISATPAVDATSLYVPDWAGNLYRIDRTTGAVLWSLQVPGLTGDSFNFSRTTPAVAGDRIVFGTQLGDFDPGTPAQVIAVSKQTGAPLWSTVVDEHFASVITQSPVVFGNRVYVGVASLEEAFAGDPNYPCCSFRGSVVALDLRTGALLWKTYTAPDPLTTGFAGNAVWGSTPVVDVKRNSLYVTTGNNYAVPDEVITCVETGGTPETVYNCIQAVPGSGDNFFDAVVALDLDTGAVRWATAMIPFDAWTFACVFDQEINCPSRGPDYDFGQGPALYTVRTPDGQRRELLGAGQKSGIYWALDPENGQIVWATQVGPGGHIGGLQWGSATDGDRIYTAVSNSDYLPHVLMDGTTVQGGFWAALDAATGQVLWDAVGAQPPAVEPYPSGAKAMNWGAVTVANGVVFAGALDAAGTMYAFDARTGNILWSFESGASIGSGAAVVDGTVYWGSGYDRFGLGIPGSNLYAFSVPTPPFSVSPDSQPDLQVIASEVLPTSVDLYQNAPNPFSSTTRIRFDLPEGDHVRLAVFDLTGREVARLVDRRLGEGRHQVDWDATSLPSGTYLYRMTTSRLSRTKTMSLLR